MPKNVLIVEDTNDIAQFVKIALEAMGLDAFHASNSERAMEYLQNNKPDLIVLDIGLPGMSGWQLLDVIKELREKNGIRIVVTTAFTDPANRLMGKLQEVDRYLFKPFEVKELQDVVGELLQM
jgi:DNA-binding response OmpR family regulator